MEKIGTKRERKKGENKLRKIDEKKDTKREKKRQNRHWKR